MTPPTFLPSTIYLAIDVSRLSLIDAEKFYRLLKDFPIPAGCDAAILMDVDEVEE